MWVTFYYEMLLQEWTAHDREDDVDDVEQKLKQMITPKFVRLIEHLDSDNRLLQEDDRIHKLGVLHIQQDCKQGDDHIPQGYNQDCKLEDVRILRGYTQGGDRTPQGCMLGDGRILQGCTLVDVILQRYMQEADRQDCTLEDGHSCWDYKVAVLGHGSGSLECSGDYTLCIYLNSGPTVVRDNYYTSFELAINLLDKKTHLLGTQDQIGEGTLRR
nr:unnamed protein product [Callosobruchus chinensis]